MDSEQTSIVDQPKNSDRELVNKLRLMDLEAGQELLNERFSLERRKQILEEAPKDAKGRSVRYYRRMSREYLLAILERGEISSYDYYDSTIPRARRHETLDSQPKIEDLKTLLKRLEPESDDIDEKRSFRDRVRQISFDADGNQPLIEYVSGLFPMLDVAIVQEAFRNPTFGTVLKFVEEHFPIDIQKQLHTGSLSQKFSALLSLSAGGVVGMGIDRRRREFDVSDVYVEMVVPEDELIIHPNGVQGEKEVFVRKIRTNQITRVLSTDQQIADEVIQDKTSAIGQYYEEHKHDKAISWHGLTDWDAVVEKWRWAERTDDCLPVSKKT